MALENEQKAIVLWNKNHKEKDKLVKIFTEKHGKLMCYARGIHQKNSMLKSVIQPFSCAVFLGKFNDDGLSFLNAAKEVESFSMIQQDIFIHAHATYILGLLDAAIEDRQEDRKLFHLVELALILLNNGNDEQIITNIFEVQLLPKFGMTPNWLSCAICGETHGAFDYSMLYGGVICQKHWDKDKRRLHGTPKVVHLLRIFSQIPYERIGNITVKKETKNELRRLIDLLYEEYVGIHLKSKTFLNQMNTWEDRLKLTDKTNEMPK